ncbi:hypothetical protein TSARBOMBA_249 [Bacillus phage TsarBomba]|uniref:Uncharacterized protein n=1 Tax=Bacillus phage TsarBomba TaxID=1690456 RepID=A0A0K2CZU9_9CAUD|nr:hypothetical protein TSARBOMBA_249 [Bacillus phage TsarBomba]ALA13089.1 hypothetical protein TSARBOMBA_249 [Bacillus phage TsarBomba]
MSTAQLAIIISMSISGGIIGYLAARLQQEKNKVELLIAARRVVGKISYDVMIDKLNSDYTAGKISYDVYLDQVAKVNRVYGRGE